MEFNEIAENCKATRIEDLETQEEARLAVRDAEPVNASIKIVLSTRQDQRINAGSQLLRSSVTPEQEEMLHENDIASLPLCDIYSDLLPSTMRLIDVPLDFSIFLQGYDFAFMVVHTLTLCKKKITLRGDLYLAIHLWPDTLPGVTSARRPKCNDGKQPPVSTYGAFKKAAKCTCLQLLGALYVGSVHLVLAFPPIVISHNSVGTGCQMLNCVPAAAAHRPSRAFESFRLKESV